MKKFSAVAMSLYLVVGMTVPAFAVGEKNAGRQELEAARLNFQAQQKQENAAFRATLKGMPKEQQLTAIQQQQQRQFAAQNAFGTGQHAKRMADLDIQLAQNTKLTPEQKTAIRNQVEANYQEDVAFRNTRFNTTQANVLRILSDTTLSQEQRKAAIQNAYDQNQASTRQYQEAQHKKLKDLRGTFKIK